MGLVAGTLSLGLLKLGGISMEEVRYWQYQFHAERSNQFRQVIKEHNEKEDMQILKQYRETHSHLQHDLETVDQEKTVDK